MDFIKKNSTLFAIIAIALFTIAIARKCIHGDGPARNPNPGADATVRDAADTADASGDWDNAHTPVKEASSPPVRAPMPSVEPLVEPLSSAPYQRAKVTPEEFEAMSDVYTLWDKQRRALIAAQEDLDPDEFERLLGVVDAQANEAYAMILGDRLEPFVRDLQAWGAQEALPALSQLSDQF